MYKVETQTLNPPAVAERPLVVLPVAAAVPREAGARARTVVAQAFEAALHPLLRPRLASRAVPCRIEEGGCGGVMRGGGV